MIVGEADSAVSDLFPQDTVLFNEIIDRALLMLAQPTGDAGEYEPKGRLSQAGTTMATNFHKKRMNVGDLVTARRLEMEELARSFMSGVSFPREVFDLLRVEGISPENAILVSYSPEPECCAGHFAGLVLTAEARFLEFDVELRLGRRAEVIDVTDETDTRERIPAIGTTDGHLALRLLETLTSEGMVHGRSL